MADTANRVTDEAVQIGINRSKMADVLGVSALPFASRVGILGVTGYRRVTMARSAVCADAVSGDQGNRPGGICEVKGAASMAAFAVTGRLVVVNGTVVVHLNLPITMAAASTPVVAVEGEGVTAGSLKVVTILTLVRGASIVLSIDH